MFISVEEFAAALGLSPHTVRQMARDHRIAVTRTSPGRGGQLLVLRSEVDRLVAEAEAWRHDPSPSELDEDDEDQEPVAPPAPTTRPSKRAAAKKTTSSRPRKRAQ